MSEDAAREAFEEDDYKVVGIGLRRRGRAAQLARLKASEDEARSVVSGLRRTMAARAQAETAATDFVAQLETKLSELVGQVASSATAAELHDVVGVMEDVLREEAELPEAPLRLKVKAYDFEAAGEEEFNALYRTHGEGSKSGSKVEPTAFELLAQEYRTMRAAESSPNLSLTWKSVSRVGDFVISEMNELVDAFRGSVNDDWIKFVESKLNDFERSVQQRADPSDVHTYSDLFSNMTFALVLASRLAQGLDETTRARLVETLKHFTEAGILIAEAVSAPTLVVKLLPSDPDELRFAFIETGADPNVL